MAASSDTELSGKQCLNCGTPLQGHWCHVCGQPVKGMVRHFTSIIGDVLDTLFEYDNRIWRTLAPLYFSPGKVTCDFVAGRRMRYVLPFRLFFVLSVVAFLTLQFINAPQRLLNLGFEADPSGFAAYDTVEEVIAERDRTLAELASTIAELEADPNTRMAASGVRTAMAAVNRAADRRLQELDPTMGSAPDDVPGEVVEPEPPESPRFLWDGAELWSADADRLQIDWLPDWLNRQIHEWISRAAFNIERAGENPARLIDAMLNMLPVVLFVLMPVFALLLKFAYMFSGRLYMEHLIVALHSHSFLFMGILVALGLNALSSLASGVPVLGTGLRYVFIVSLWWFPLYLLLMQKRVYGQGWILTLIKYNVLGILYIVMITLALIFAAVVSLINL